MFYKIYKDPTPSSQALKVIIYDLHLKLCRVELLHMLQQSSVPLE